MQAESEEDTPVAILTWLVNHGPATTEQIHAQFPSRSKGDLVDLLNKLSVAGDVEILHGGSAGLRWRAAVGEAKEKLALLRSMQPEERQVYQVIEKEGNMGIWTRDLRFKSGLQQMQLNRALKSLESKNLIKAVKSIAGRNRKVYMLYDLEPSVKVKGNSFYTSDGKFDSDFVEELNAGVYEYIERQGSVTLERLRAFVQTSGFSRVELKDDEVQQVIDTLIYDGKIDQVNANIAGQTSTVYKPSRVPLPSNGLTSIPCGRCPVFYMCEDEGDVTPVKCPYLTQWLDMKW